MSPAGSPTSAQLSFDELGTPLREVTFVVLDLETTGGAATSDAITEIGAVKVRGGERVGELATLVDPGTGVPPSIVALTGITTAMVTGAPPALGGAARRSWSSSPARCWWRTTPPSTPGSCAPRASATGSVWPRPPVLCTARLARAVLSVDEAPSVRLGALARLFDTATTPNHRALADARATVEVLHRLLERVGNVGVQSLPELLALASDAAAHRPTTAQRRKRTLAEAVPSAPGVYLFRGARDEVLYVGTSGDLRRRVRSYFTSGERRRRVRDMVALAERVDTVVCAHALEAGVRELRLIAAHRPRYNRRSRAPHHAWWVTPTAEAFPRLSVVATPRDGAAGPFRSRQAAAAAVETVLGRRAGAFLHPTHPGAAARGRAPARCTSWAAAPRRAQGCRPRPNTRLRSSPCADCSAAATTRRCARLPRRHRRPRRPRAVRDRGPPPRPARRAGAGARPRRSGWPRSPPSTSWSERGPTGAAAGRSRSCATDGSPRPGSPRAACRRCR